MASPFQLRENFSGTKSVRFFFSDPSYTKESCGSNRDIRSSSRNAIERLLRFLSRFDRYFLFFFFGNSLAVIKKNVGLNT